MPSTISAQLSIDAKVLSDRLRTIETGALITYDSMNEIIHRNVRGQARHVLQKAREILLKEGIRFDVVKTQGIRRMTDSEVAQSGSQSVRKVGRTARREMKKLVAIRDFNSLPNEDKIQHNATLSVLGAVAHFTKPQQVKILEAAVAEVRESLPIAGTISTIQRALTTGPRRN